MRALSKRTHRKQRRRGAPGNIVQSLVCHFFRNSSHIFNLSLHRHEQASFELVNKATEKGIATQGLTGSARVSIRLMESYYQAPCWLIWKWPRSVTMSQCFPLGNSPTFVLWRKCPLYRSIFQFLIHKSSTLSSNITEEKCLKQVMFLGWRKTWHLADLQCKHVLSFCPLFLLPFKYLFYDMLSCFFLHKRERVAFPAPPLSKLTAVHLCSDFFFPCKKTSTLKTTK